MISIIKQKNKSKKSHRLIEIRELSKNYKVIRISQRNYTYIIQLLAYGDTINDGVTKLVLAHEENNFNKLFPGRETENKKIEKEK